MIKSKSINKKQQNNIKIINSDFQKNTLMKNFQYVSIDFFQSI